MHVILHQYTNSGVKAYQRWPGCSFIQTRCFNDQHRQLKQIEQFKSCNLPSHLFVNGREFFIDMRPQRGYTVPLFLHDGGEGGEESRLKRWEEWNLQCHQQQEKTDSDDVTDSDGRSLALSVDAPLTQSPTTSPSNVDSPSSSSSSLSSPSKLSSRLKRLPGAIPLPSSVGFGGVGGGGGASTSPLLLSHSFSLRIHIRILNACTRGHKIAFKRLLESIQQADYDPATRIDIEFSTVAGGGGGAAGEEVEIETQDVPAQQQEEGKQQATTNEESSPDSCTSLAKSFQWRRGVVRFLADLPPPPSPPLVSPLIVKVSGVEQWNVGGIESAPVLILHSAMQLSRGYWRWMRGIYGRYIEGEKGKGGSGDVKRWMGISLVTQTEYINMMAKKEAMMNNNNNHENNGNNNNDENKNINTPASAPAPIDDCEAAFDHSSSIEEHSAYNAAIHALEYKFLRSTSFSPFYNSSSPPPPLYRSQRYPPLATLLFPRRYTEFLEWKKIMEIKCQEEYEAGGEGGGEQQQEKLFIKYMYEKGGFLIHPALRGGRLLVTSTLTPSDPLETSLTHVLEEGETKFFWSLNEIQAWDIGWRCVPLPDILDRRAAILGMHRWHVKGECALPASSIHR